MKKCLLILLLAKLLIPAQASGQEVPKVTEVGKEAFGRLLVACRDNRAVRVVRRPNGTEVPVVDQAKLKAAVVAHPELLTPALRDTMVADWFGEEAVIKPVTTALLRAYAEEKKDERALAFAALFTAVEERDQKPRVAVLQYQEAARHFSAPADAGWQAICFTDLGLTCHYLGEFPKALDYLRQALARWREAHHRAHPGTANCLGNLGLAYRDFGDYAKALDYHQQALAMRRQLSNDARDVIAHSLNNIGEDYHQLGDYAKSLECYREALAVLRKLHDKPHPDIALTLDNIGAASAALGEIAREMDNFRHALAVRRELYHGPHRDLAQSLHNLGTAYEDSQDYPKALDYLQQALAMKRKLYDGPHPDLALTLNNLGSVHSALKDSARALDCYQQALAVWRKLHAGPQPDVAACLTNISAVYDDLEQSGRSLEVLDEAVKEVCRPMGSTPPTFERLQPDRLRPLPLTASILHRRGQTLEQALPGKPAVRQLRACAHCYALAADVLDRVRAETLVQETSKLVAGAKAASLSADRVGICRRLYELEGDREYLRTAFRAAEQGQARVFLEALGRSRAGLLGGVSRELREREADLLFRLHAYDLHIGAAESRAGQSDPPLPKLWQERRQAELELQKLIADVSKQYSRYSALKYPKPCALEEARACLGKNEVALLYVLGAKASYVLQLDDPGTQGNGLAIRALPPAAQLAEQVTALTDPATLASADKTAELAAEVYAALLGPLAERLRGKDLVIVPNGALCYLPFELLVEPADKGEAPGRFLVEGHRLRYAPSLTALALQRQWDQARPRPDRTLFALGDPVYDHADARLGGKATVLVAGRDRAGEYALREGRGGFPRLPFSGTEVEQIGKLLGAAKDDIRTGAAATETAVKATSATGQLARYRYLHFATHGILGLDTGKQPALVLSQVGDDHEDGFLQLDEVTNLKLNADLVVLSACRSGQGHLYNGEGVKGLARAFLYAGSRGVLCSLWQVEDQETARLMVQFYTNLKQGQAAAEALRNAQLEMIHRDKAPLYWAPFVLIGE